MPMATREEQREYQRRWVAQRRAEFFTDKTCIDCGATERLEIDHVDPKQKISHRIWSWSKARRDVELAKCVVRCHDCHITKTRLNGEKPRGEANGRCSRLTEVTAAEVKFALSLGVARRVIAEVYDCSIELVNNIAAGRRWSHVQVRPERFERSCVR